MYGVEETGPNAAGGAVLVRTTDSKPLIASRVVGQGEVVFVTTSMDERWTTFPGRSSDAFVSFIQLVMTHLKQLDAVAYVRFASVYRSFQDIGEFMRELEMMRAHQSEAPS